MAALATAGALTTAVLVAVTSAAPSAAAVPARAAELATSAAVAAAFTSPGYTPLTPVRICDTRAAGAGVAANQCDTAGHSPLAPGESMSISVAGIAGVPAAATMVVLHVTATGTSASSFLTVWPTGAAQPLASSLNWSPGQTVANLVASGVGTNGQVSIFNDQGNADVVVDLEGYAAAATGSLYVPVAPVRVCDTRLSQPANQCNANGTAAGTLAGGGTKIINVESGFGVPAGTTGVVLNVTATTTSAASYLDVYAAGATMPFASSLNWSAGQTVSNRVFTAVDASGNINVFNAFGHADVVVDLNGYFSPSTGSSFYPVTPTRICDTRPAGPGVASNVCDMSPLGTLSPGESIDLFGFNSSVTAFVLNVTVTNTHAPGFLTVFPDDATQIPLAADVTFAAGQTVPNLTVADLGSTAGFVFFNGSNGNTDVVIDIVGYFLPATGAAESQPAITLRPSSLLIPKGAKIVHPALSGR